MEPERDESRRLLQEAALALLDMDEGEERPFLPALIGLIDRVAGEEVLAGSRDQSAESVDLNPSSNSTIGR
ncbi:MAG: hypothetical protein U0800_00825 [Isosphaeraceae bacterium]